MQIASRDSRGWYFNDIASDTPNTICKILARWYQDVSWVWRIYGYYSQLVRARELSSWIPEANDPRLHTWSDPTKDYNDVGAVVDRPPYPSLDALKAAIPLPTLRLYFKPSASGLVMKTAVHDIHHPVRSKIVQIPDTHYNTPPRVTQLPTKARENEIFQLVGDQYRPDSDHTWTFEPGKATVNDRTVLGAAHPNVLSSGQGRFGRISASKPSELPIVFQAAAARAFIAYSDDPEHFYFYIHNSRVSTSDVITIEMHGERSDGSPIIKTGTFRYSRASGDDRVFQARVSGAYGALDLSDNFSISIKRGNTYLYMDTSNIPPTAEWETGLLNTAGLYKGKADGTFARAVILEETTLDLIVNRFGGRELLEKTGSYPYRVIANANAALTDAIATNDTRFSDTGLFLNQQNNADDKHLSQFDRLLFEVYLLNGSNVAVASTSFTMSLTQLSAIVAQGSANVSATNQVDATVEDGRAVIHNWRTKDKPIVPVEIETGSGGNWRNRLRDVQDNLRGWIDDFRKVDHTIFIGRTGETNSRLLIAVKSHKLGIGLQVRGYH